MTTRIRMLIEKLRSHDDRIFVEDVIGDVIDRALGELLELEKTRDILVITASCGHWAVPFTEGALRELRIAIRNEVTAEEFRKLVRALRGTGLVDETYHNCSFYSHVVVHDK